MKYEDYEEEIQNNKKVKKIFKEIYFEDFDDPNEDFTDSLYDLIPPKLVENELKKLKGVKYKHGQFYTVEKVRKGKK